jgi:hypothetical protein
MLRITKIRVSVSQLKMRRLAARALRLISKYAGIDATFAALAVMLIAACQRFSAAFDNRPTTSQNKKIAEGQQAVDRLRSTVSRWLTMLAINASDLLGNYTNSRVPEDVIANAKRLVVDLSAPRPGTDAPLPYAEAAVDELNELIPATQEAWDEARAERAAVQELKQELRDAASELQPLLVAFRQLLLNVVGRRHVDYQTLRPSRVLETTDESDPVEEDEVGDDEAEEAVDETADVNAMEEPGGEVPNANEPVKEADSGSGGGGDTPGDVGEPHDTGGT